MTSEQKIASVSLPKEFLWWQSSYHTWPAASWTTKSQQWTELGPEGSPERPQKDPRMFKTFKMFMLSPGTRVSVQTNLMVFQPACWCDLVQPWSHDPLDPVS